MVEDLTGHQIEGVIDYSLSQDVVSSLMGLIYSLEKIHHVFIRLSFHKPLTHTVDSFNNYSVNYFACVSVDKADPLVNYIALRAKLYFNGFQHLNSPHNFFESFFRRLLIAFLVHQNEILCILFKFLGHI